MASYGFEAASTRRDRFCITGYDSAPPFASFLPGIAGPLGIPLWAFYTNRGQAMASFGVGSKDSPIMEFVPANKAYQSVSLTGFRTFIKVAGAAEKAPVMYEPFAVAARPAPARTMFIEASELELEETNEALGLRVNVLYFTLPGEPFAGLVRQVTVENTGGEALDLEILDGMPAVIPYGVGNAELKHIGRTAEAWMAVYNHEAGVPFYRVQASMGDEAEVATVQAGHFYLPFVQPPDAAPGAAPEVTRPAVFVDPQVVFGQNTSFIYPDGFSARALGEMAGQRQVTVSRTPCAFAGASATLGPGESVAVYSITGHVSGIDVIEAERERLAQPSYVAAKRAEAAQLTSDLTAPIATHTAVPRFDAYCRQTLLDNILRGGWPVKLGTKVFYLYGRRHGDLERDYNDFRLPAEFYSQGNAAYRDLNQNRRSDVLLNPSVRDREVLAFLGLIQPDGYNPLVVLGTRFLIPPEKRAELLALVDRPQALEKVLARPLTPGSLLKAVFDGGLRLPVPPEAFVATALVLADEDFGANYGEGYWMDHWYYNLDLIQSYLAVYPDRQDELLFERTVTYFDSPAFVQPRDRKYVLAGESVRQYGAVVIDKEHAALIAARTEVPDLVRGEHGRGEIFRSTVFAKLLLLAGIKFATLDPLGMGIEMEAGRPGWCDALNGLPGIFGSSMPATYELSRLLTFLSDAIEGKTGVVDLPLEAVVFLGKIDTALAGYEDRGDPDRDFHYWDAAASAREAYRESTRAGFGGATGPLFLAYVAMLLRRMRDKVADAIQRAEATGDGLPASYFYHEVTDYSTLIGTNGEPPRDEYGRAYVRALRFEQFSLPPFLEGAMHALRTRPRGGDARQLYDRVKASDLYDRKLSMYKTNAPLEACSHEIGRLRAFTPGWLENESVFLHMSYKYLLEVLRAGLTEEFFAEMRCGLVPFLDPAVYGRSTLENSSFIVSSAHPDESLHGRGFVARLTGACAEFLSMWSFMMAGPRPFFVKNGQLCLSFKPVLPPWLFREDGTLGFTFLGRCQVTYRRNGAAGPEPKVTGGSLHLLDGGIVTLRSDIISEPYASMIRAGEIRRIELELA